MMPTATMRTYRVTLNPWAECETDGCDWSHLSSRVTRDRAKHHARNLGHRVIVIAEDRTVYTAEEVK